MTEKDILIAKNECIMNDEINVKALVIGKEYPVKGIFNQNIIIDSEFHKNHYFDLDEKSDSYWSKYFNKK